MTHLTTTDAIAGLRQAVPYLRLFVGKTFVVKAGGEALDDERAARGLLEQVGTLASLGIKTVLVHGGGKQATETAERLRVPSRMVDGRRVTSPEMLDAMAMTVPGLVQTRLLGTAHACGVRAVGLSGPDDGLFLAEKRPPVVIQDGKTVDYGLVGDLSDVRPAAVEAVLAAGAVPVVATLAVSPSGQLLNVNADTAAAALAVALGAEKLLFVTGAPGVLGDADDPTSLVSQTDLAGLAALESAGSLSGGMLPKAAAVRRALEGGVPSVHIVGASVPDSLLVEVFTNEGCGTLVTRSLA